MLKSDHIEFRTEAARQSIKQCCKDGYSRPITKKEKETCEQAKDEGIGLTPQQKFSNECLEVYDVDHFQSDSVEIRKTERSL